jgi:hypothetical protein
MGNSEQLDQIERWCADEGWIELAERGLDAGGNPRLMLAVCPPDTPRRAGFPTEATYFAGTGRLVITQRASLPEELSRAGTEGIELDAGLERIIAYLLDRPGVLVPEMADVEGGPAMALRLTLWAEGLGKHAFLTALVDLDKTRENVERMFRELIASALAAPAEAPEAASPAPPPPSVQSKTFCTGCGKQLKPGAAFCSSCGKPV